jgi:hypothetical protein
MRKTVEVVDDFHPEPAVVRAAALGLAWRGAAADDPPAGCTWVVDAPADEDTAGRLRRLLGPAARAGWGGLSRAVYTVAGETPAGPGVTTLGRPGWGALVWLCPPGQCRGGISFYRPRDPGGPVGDGPDMGGRADGWEETMFVPARFNRMVLFDSSVAYRSGPGFGQDPESGSLTQFVLVEPTTTE